MVHCTKEWISCQVESEVKKLNETECLPFQELLDGERIDSALESSKIEYRDRIFNPWVTLWAFLSQVTASNDRSCENAVSRVRADRVANGQKPCSTDTSSYCKARARIPEQVVPQLTRETGQSLHRQASPQWLWKGRHVHIVDGSTSTMADTEENQKEYPQSSGQKIGLGFPILRFVVVLSLSVGTVLECAIGSCKGKGTGEQSLFRKMWHIFHSGDIVLGDRLYDAYRDIALLKRRGVDSVFGKNQSRQCDFRLGRRLGPSDHIVVWNKPKYDSSRFESKEEWEALPESLEMREVRITIRRTGYRTHHVIIVTTLLNAEEYSSKELTDLFSQRWHCELDLRSIKRVFRMHHLRCKTPDMVRKELWMHLLAYNLIRVRMAQAAAVHELLPRTLSFTTAMNHIANYAEHLCRASGEDHRRIEDDMLRAIASCRVGNRPGRKEPRAVKKRPQKYSFLTKPRALARKGLAA
jgi:hypothetical protein